MKHIINVIFIFIVIGAGLGLKHFLAVDNCADDGGWWDPDAQACETEAAGGELPADFLDSMAAAESIDLLSVSSRKASENSFIEKITSEREELFFGYPVLGRLKIKQASAVKILLKALVKDIQDGEALGGGAVYPNFKPHYGIEFARAKEINSLVICFECGQIKVYRNRKFSGRLFTTAESQKLVDSILDDNRVTREKRRKAAAPVSPQTTPPEPPPASQPTSQAASEPVSQSASQPVSQ